MAKKMSKLNGIFLKTVQRHAKSAKYLCFLLPVFLSSCAPIPPATRDSVAKNADECKLDRKYIGVAILDSDDSMRVFLWSTERTHGGAMLRVNRDNPYFEKVVNHIDGKLKIGEYLYIKSMCDEGP